MYLRKRLGKLLLPQQKIPIAPSNLGGNRVSGLGHQESFTRTGGIAGRFIGVGQIGPVERRARINVQGPAVQGNRERQGGMLKKPIPGSRPTGPSVPISPPESRRPPPIVGPP